MKRVISLVVSLVLAASAMFLAPATASASAEAAAKPKRPISISFDQVGKSTNIKFFGKATDYRKKKAILQEKKGGKWKKIAKDQTQKNGKYKMVIKVPRGKGTHKYRVQAKGDKNYKKSTSVVLSGSYR